jgi:hypothetical protein
MKQSSTSTRAIERQDVLVGPIREIKAHFESQGTRALILNLLGMATHLILRLFSGLSLAAIPTPNSSSSSTPAV